jgi:hypothetical protein
VTTTTEPETTTTIVETTTSEPEPETTTTTEPETTTTTEPETTTTIVETWIPVGACFGGPEGLGDLEYLGPVDTYGNFLLWSSEDGTCDGTSAQGDGRAIVRGASPEQADDTCALLDGFVVGALAMEYPEAPDDAYVCVVDVVIDA